MLPAAASSARAVTSLRRVLLWSLVAAAIVTGIILYFRYERMLTPLVG